MTSQYYNLVGALAWITIRESVSSDNLNASWHNAKKADLDHADIPKDVVLDRAVAAARISQCISLEILDGAKAELCAACAEGKLAAIGRKFDKGDMTIVPMSSWLDVEIDEVRSAIGIGRAATWVGIRLVKVDVRRLWPANPAATTRAPKKRTWPKANHREEISGILDQVDLAEMKAIERGEQLPPRPTNKQIAERLFERHGKRVAIRTVSHNVTSLGGNVNRRLPSLD